MYSSTVLALLTTLPILASAHFQLVFPASRGSDDTNQATFPCGGYSQTQNRTLVSLTSLSINTNLGHTESLITVLLAIGNNVGDSFNTVILPTIQEYGPGNFCLPSIRVPAHLNITDGTNATIQVMTDSHGGGGLYNCADVTFTSTSPQQPSSCTNGTGISATPLAASTYTFANESTSHGSASSSASGSASATKSGTATSATGSGGAAAMHVAGWGLVGAVMLGGAAML